MTMFSMEKDKQIKNILEEVWPTGSWVLSYTWEDGSTLWYSRVKPHIRAEALVDTEYSYCSVKSSLFVRGRETCNKKEWGNVSQKASLVKKSLSPVKNFYEGERKLWRKTLDEYENPLEKVRDAIWILQDALESGEVTREYVMNHFSIGKLNVL